jgi:branched-chain amino acid transport system permease protein
MELAEITTEKKGRLKVLLFLTGLIILLFVPRVVANEYYLRVINNILLYSILTLGLNVVLGYCGQFHFAQAALYGVGAYVTACLMKDYHVNFLLALGASALFATVIGLLIGIPSLRIRGDYLALVTFAFGEIAHLIMLNWVEVTNGPMGIPGIPRPQLLSLRLTSNSHFYYYGLILTILTYVITRQITHSYIGRALLAIRQNETVAAAMGINAAYYKMLAFAVSSFFAGVAGAYLATYLTFVGPLNFTLDESILMVEMVIIGGMANLPGSIVGVAVFVLAIELFRPIAQFRKVFMGIMILVVLIWRPDGLFTGLHPLPLLRRAIQRVRGEQAW